MARYAFDNSLLREVGSFDKLTYLARIRDLTPNVLVFTKFGKNEDIDAAATEDIWSVGGTRTVALTAGVVELLSSSAEDDPVKAGPAVGTGAHSVTLSGYDSDYNLIEETVTLNGTAAVETTQTFADIYRAVVASAGTGLTNAGTITIRHKVGPVTLADIPASEGQSHNSHFVVPAGYTGYLTEVILGLGGNQSGAGPKNGRISLGTYNIPAGVTTDTFDQFFTSDSGQVVVSTESKFTVPEKHKIWFTIYSETVNSVASAIYTIVCIKNELST